MPEGDTIYRATRTLHQALAGKVVSRFESVLPALNRIHEDAPITGRIVEKVSANGKWNLMQFSGDLILLTHMLMNGSWHIYRLGERWQKGRDHMRIVVGAEDIIAVAFDVPVAEFHTARSLLRREGYNQLGEDVLGGEFDMAEALRNVKARGEEEAGNVLLDQRVLAGVGNIFKSEVCFASGVNPFDVVSSLSDEQIAALVRNARKLLQANVRLPGDNGFPVRDGMRRTTGYAAPAMRLAVYGRNRKPCWRCGTPIRSQKQGPGARTTFWCPQCQPRKAT